MTGGRTYGLQTTEATSTYLYEYIPSIFDILIIKYKWIVAVNYFLAFSGSLAKIGLWF